MAQDELNGVRLLRGAKVSEFLRLTNPIQGLVPSLSRDMTLNFGLPDLTHNTGCNDRTRHLILT